MNPFQSAWLAREQRRWLRNDANRWLRPDHTRFGKRQQIEHKYNPNQPRVPAGNSNGGRWTDGGASSPLLAPISIPMDAFGFEGADGGLEGLTQLAFVGQLFQGAAQAGRVVALGFEAALSAFTALSARNGTDGTAVAIFRSAEFQPGVDPRAAIGWAAWLTPEELERACPAQGLVQSMTDTAAAAIDRDSYTAQSYGTAVHTRLSHDIRNLLNPNLQSEVSILKTLEETGELPKLSSPFSQYGERGSIRIDVLENAGNSTVCVYDIKTGNRPLSVARMREIAQTVAVRFGGIRRIIVTETRPRR